MDFIRANSVTQLHEPKTISDWAGRLLKEALNYPIWQTLAVTSKIITMAQSAPGKSAAVDFGPTAAHAFDCSQLSAVKDKEAELEIIVR
jgi:hypothetical protein